MLAVISVMLAGGMYAAFRTPSKNEVQKKSSDDLLHLLFTQTKINFVRPGTWEEEAGLKVGMSYWDSMELLLKFPERNLTPNGYDFSLDHWINVESNPINATMIGRMLTAVTPVVHRGQNVLEMKFYFKNLSNVTKRAPTGLKLLAKEPMQPISAVEVEDFISGRHPKDLKTLEGTFLIPEGWMGYKNQGIIYDTAEKNAEVRSKLNLLLDAMVTRSPASLDSKFPARVALSRHMVATYNSTKFLKPKEEFSFSYFYPLPEAGNDFVHLQVLIEKDKSPSLTIPLNKRYD